MKFNYRSQKNYIIDKVILEKRLIYDCSIFNYELTIHVITDLEACYNCQLSNICRLIEESLRILREGIKLITKTIIILRYYICISFGISKESYGDRKQYVGGTR